MSQPASAAPSPIPGPPPAFIPSAPADGTAAPAPFDHLSLRELLDAKRVDLDDLAWDYGLSLDALTDILDGRRQPPEHLRARWEREIASFPTEGAA